MKLRRSRFFRSPASLPARAANRLRTRNSQIFNLALDYLIANATFSASVCAEAAAAASGGGGGGVSVTTHVSVPLAIARGASADGLTHGTVKAYVERERARAARRDARGARRAARVANARERL